MIRRYRGHIIMVEHETQDGVPAVRYDITSDTGQGAAVGNSGWLYQVKSLSNAARECERVVDNAIAGDAEKLAGQAVSS